MKYDGKKYSEGDRRNLKLMEDMTAPGNFPRESKRELYNRGTNEIAYNYPGNAEVMYRKQWQDSAKVRKQLPTDMF